MVYVGFTESRAGCVTYLGDKNIWYYKIKCLSLPTLISLCCRSQGECSGGGVRLVRSRDVGVLLLKNTMFLITLIIRRGCVLLLCIMWFSLLVVKLLS